MAPEASRFRRKPEASIARKRIFVADISAFSGSLTEQFQVGEVDRRLKKDGQAYLTFALKDRSGEIPGKLWEIPAGFSVTDGDFVKVEAEIGTYRDEVQLNIRRIRKLAREEIELEDFLSARHTSIVVPK